MGAIFSTRNWLDEAGVTFSVTTGTMSRALTELQTPWGEGLARGAYSGSAILIFRVDLGAVRDICTLGLLGLNGRAQVQFFLGTTAGGDDILSSDGVMYEPHWGFPFGAACWVHPSAGAPWAARYLMIRVDVFDGPTYVDMRRLWVGGGLILPDGVDSGWELNFEDGSYSERTDEGGVSVDERQRWRKLAASRVLLTETEAVGGTAGTTPGLFSQLATVGKSREIVVAVRAYPDTNEESYRRRYFNTIYGQLTSWQPLRSRKGNRFGVARFEVTEAPLPPL